MEGSAHIHHSIEGMMDISAVSSLVHAFLLHCQNRAVRYNSKKRIVGLKRMYIQNSNEDN